MTALSLSLSLDEAACINNALRRELEIAERYLRDPNMIGAEEYVRNLDACLRRLTSGYEKAARRHER